MGAVPFNKVTRGYAVTLAPAGKYPIVGDRIFNTLQAAQDYVDGKADSKTAIPGIYLSVIADGENNGAYWVAQAAGYEGATVGILQKMGEGGGGSVEGLGSLAYKNSLSFAELTNKPTTLAGYGITDAYSQTQADARFLKLAGGTLTDTLYTKQIIAEDQVFLRMTSGDRFFRSRSIDADGVVIAEIGFGVGSDGVNRGIYDYTNGRWLLVNYGDGRVIYQGDKFLVKTAEVYEPKDGYTTPIRLGGGVRIDGSLYLPNSGQVKIANSAGDKDMIIFQLNSNNDFLVGQKTAAEGYDTYIYGNALHFKISKGITEALTITTNGRVGIGKTAPACALDVGLDLNSRNFMRGGGITDDPTSAFQSTIFGEDALLDGTYRMRLVRTGTGFGRVTSPYAATLCLKSADTHGYISIPYSASNKNKCYIGGGNANKINWKGALFHDNMDLLPVTDNTYILGNSSHRWKEVHAVSIKIGDAVITWDSAAGMLKADKGIYSEGAITAKKKA